DLTTEADFLLDALVEGVVMDEIVVQRERDLVNKNATNTPRIASGEDIRSLPVRGVQAAVVLAPGVVQQNGNLYIRGGRLGEVGYYLDGASTRNVLDGTNATTVIPEALEELQVQAGGYTAQYGGANSGIVRQTMRSGTKDFKFSLQAETDNFTSQNNQALGTYSYGYSNYVATLSGPLFSDKISFFFAGENQFDRDFRVWFWEGFHFENLVDRNRPTDTVRTLDMQSGNVPGSMRNRYNASGTLTFDFNPIIVRVSGNYTNNRQQGTALPVANLFALNRLPINQTTNVLGNLKFTHIVSSNLLYEVNFNYADNRNKINDPDHGDNFLLYQDSVANAQYGYQYQNITTGPSDYNLAGFPFRRPGAWRAGFQLNQQQRWGGSADLTWQEGTIHELKVGGSYDTYKVRAYQILGNPSSLLTWYRNNPDLARVPSAERDYQVRRNARVNNYGYDVYGNALNDDESVDGPKRPVYWSAYAQDKLEYSDLVVNAGLRFDYMDNDDIRFIDDPTTPNTVEGSTNPSVDPTTFEYKATGIEKRPAFKAVSPRLGVAFPVTDRTVFHLQWGKFIQAPSLNQLYLSTAEQSRNWGGQNYIPNPVGFDLDPERTTSYEVGFSQQISDYASFDMTAYYRDISGQIQVIKQTVDPTAQVSAYNTLVNGDFATTKGFELTIRLRRISRIQAQFNYTFADAKGTGSTNNSYVGAAEQGTQFPTVISPLDFSQAHRGAMNIDYRFGEDDGGPVLQRLGFNLLFTFNSGHPFTLATGSGGQQGPETGALIENDQRSSFPVENVNASTTPWNFNIDLRVDKTVQMGPLSTNFYIYIMNLLDTKNVQNVYRRTGNATDDGYLSDPGLSGTAVQELGPQYVPMYQAINLVDGQHYRNITGNDLWGSPRQIRFGMKIEY
ncbi:MAG TPA: hypothetical protein DGH68_11380, partial [Bacteroidetes bacterium]|nr:hypothetical protein [Bacteroidota bacterium]